MTLLLVGANPGLGLVEAIRTLGWNYETMTLDTWLDRPSSLNTSDASLVDASSIRSSEQWLQIHHHVPRIPHPLILMVDGTVPSSFHYPRAGGLRIAMLQPGACPDVLRSTVSLALQLYRSIRHFSDPSEEPTFEVLARESERREVLQGAMRQVRKDLDSILALLESGGDTAPPESPLGTREQEVLDLLLTGLSISSVAGKLGIAESTAKKHIHAIYQKRGVSSRAQLMASWAGR